jgi:hypothetical protein
MGWYGVGPGWSGWLTMAITMPAFWGLLLLGGIAVYRSLRGDRESTTRPQRHGDTVTQYQADIGNGPRPAVIPAGAVVVGVDGKPVATHAVTVVRTSPSAMPTVMSGRG